MSLASDPTASRHEHRPTVELLLLALPMIAQFSSYVVLQFIDTYMLSLVGDLAATAAGNSGGLVWSVVALGFGTLLIVNTLVSQSYGRGDHAECGRYLWQGVWFALGYGVLALLSIPFADNLFLAFGHEPALAALEADYFRICVWFCAVKLLTTACAQFLLAVNRPGIVLAATIASVLANIGANCVLIFGKLGFPAMGAAGAAWGTNVALVVELAFMVGAIALLPAIGRRYNCADWRPRRGHFAAILKVGLPAGGSTVAEVLAWSLFMVWVIGLFGTVTMAAHTYAFRFMMVSFMPAVGIGSAVTALVGRYIGAGKPYLAARRAHLGFVMSAAYMVAMGAGMVVFRHELIGLFSADPQVIRIGAAILVMMAIYQIFDAMYVVYNGALRGAGDTLAPAIVLAALVWTIGVGGGFVVATYRPELGVIGPWAAMTLYGALLGLFLMTRFARGRWKAIRLHGEEAIRRDADRLPGDDAAAADLEAAEVTGKRASAKVAVLSAES